MTEDENVIKERRKLLAREYVDDFLLKMREIGFKDEDIISVIKEAVGGKKDE